MKMLRLKQAIDLNFVEDQPDLNELPKEISMAFRIQEESALNSSKDEHSEENGDQFKLLRKST